MVRTNGHHFNEMSFMHLYTFTCLLKSYFSFRANECKSKGDVFRVKRKLYQLFNMRPVVSERNKTKRFLACYVSCAKTNYGADHCYYMHIIP